MYNLSYIKFQSLLSNRNYKLLTVYYITRGGKRNVIFLKCRIPGSNHYNLIIEIPKQYCMVFPIDSDIDNREIFETSSNIDEESINYINLIKKTDNVSDERCFVILNEDDICLVKDDEKECYTFTPACNNVNIIEPVLELEQELFNIKHKIEENKIEEEVTDNERQFSIEEESKDTILIFKDSDSEKEKNTDIKANKMSIFIICIDIKTFYKFIDKCVSIVLDYYNSIQENRTNLREKRLETIKESLEKNITLLFEKNVYVINEEKKLKEQLPRLHDILTDCEKIKSGITEETSLTNINNVYKKTSDAIDEINNNIAVINNEMEGLINKYETCLKEMDSSL